LRANTIVPQIFLKSELQIRFDRIQSLILQGIRADFIRQADAPLEVEQVRAPGKVFDPAGRDLAGGRAEVLSQPGISSGCESAVKRRCPCADRRTGR
jgi:hypothetical protein